MLLAANGAEAVSQYVQHPGDVALVLTDMAMPVMDGAATISAIRSIHPSARIIASSGLTNHSAAHALSAGVDDFISKPYTTHGLLLAIHNLLGGA